MTVKRGANDRGRCMGFRIKGFRRTNFSTVFLINPWNILYSDLVLFLNFNETIVIVCSNCIIICNKRSQRKRSIKSLLYHPLSRTGNFSLVNRNHKISKIQQWKSTNLSKVLLLFMRYSMWLVANVICCLLISATHLNSNRGKIYNSYHNIFHSKWCLRSFFITWK